jgi:hypothetical protein
VLKHPVPCSPQARPRAWPDERYDFQVSSQVLLEGDIEGLKLRLQAGDRRRCTVKRRDRSAQFFGHCFRHRVYRRGSGQLWRKRERHAVEAYPELAILSRYRTRHAQADRPIVEGPGQLQTRVLPGSSGLPNPKSGPDLEEVVGIAGRLGQVASRLEAHRHEVQLPYGDSVRASDRCLQAGAVDRRFESHAVIIAPPCGRGPSCLAAPGTHDLTYDGELADVVGVVVADEEHFTQDSVAVAPGNLRRQVRLQ